MIINCVYNGMQHATAPIFVFLHSKKLYNYSFVSSVKSISVKVVCEADYKYLDNLQEIQWIE